MINSFWTINRNSKTKTADLICRLSEVLETSCCVKFVVFSQEGAGLDVLLSLLDIHPYVETQREILSPANSGRRNLVKAKGVMISYDLLNKDQSGSVWNYLINIKDLRMIHLKRHNILRTFTARKLGTGRRGRLNKFLFTVPELTQGFIKTNLQENCIDFGFQLHQNLSINYEELTADPEYHFKRIIDFLGLPYLFPQGYLKKHETDDLRVRISNYSSLKHAFKGTRWRQFFDEDGMNLISEIIPDQQLISNCRFLPTRAELIKEFPLNSIGAEIGVDVGGFSKKILHFVQPQKLYLIDAWASPRSSIEKMKLVENSFKSEIQSGQVIIRQGYSFEELERFPDNYFDWVYIDTDHTYETTLLELTLSEKKVKPGGIIAGHDFIKGGTRSPFGVIEAVNEFCNDKKWEIVFLTSEPHQYRSFALKRKLPDQRIQLQDNDGSLDKVDSQLKEE